MPAYGGGSQQYIAHPASGFATTFREGNVPPDPILTIQLPAFLEELVGAVTILWVLIP